MNIALIRDVKTPTRGSDKSAGIDFYIPNDYDGKLKLGPGEHVLIPSGVKANVPEGYMLTAFNKIGIATKNDLVVGACVVDEDYQGEIHLHLINVGHDCIKLVAGQKITQFILIPVFYDTIQTVHPDELYEAVTSRGDGGFGSTGIN